MSPLFARRAEQDASSPTRENNDFVEEEGGGAEQDASSPTRENNDFVEEEGGGAEQDA